MKPSTILLASSAITFGGILLTGSKLEDHRRDIESLRKRVINNEIDAREIKGGRGRE